MYRFSTYGRWVDLNCYSYKTVCYKSFAFHLFIWMHHIGYKHARSVDTCTDA